MLEFQKLKYRNFLSTGNTYTEIDLGSTPTTLVVGNNGSGKCLRGNTEIDIRIRDAATQAKFDRFMKSKKSSLPGPL